MLIGKTHDEPTRYRFEGVTKRFGDTTAVDDLELTIRQGEFFSLLGPSGCGKTTTLRMVAGFEQPTEGQIYLDGEPVAGVPPYKRNVNTVFQSYALFDAPRRAGQRRLRPQAPQGGEGRDRRSRVKEALELVQLTGREKSKPCAALGRPAAARGAGPCARQPPGGAAARRAARRARPEAAAADAGRAQGDPARGRHHLPLRHPRPGGGAGDVRPDRGHGRRRGRAVRPARGDLREPRPSRSWPGSSASPT